MTFKSRIDELKHEISKLELRKEKNPYNFDKFQVRIAECQLLITIYESNGVLNNKESKD